jgi:phosphatidylglycerol---prolipoprotein diacylglyceryl transferase
MIHINIDPVAFAFGPLQIRWYGLMMSLAVLVLISWSVIQVRRGARLTFDDILGAALVGIPTAIVFSRFLYLLDNWVHGRFPVVFGGEGLTIYGAILGAALGAWIYSRFNKIDFAYMADVVTPGIILAQAIGRIGCVINGCCFGEIATNLPWGVIYENPNCYAGEYIGVPVHPTNAYEIIFLLILFGVIMATRSKFKAKGSQFLFYLGMYGLWRLLVGFLRINEPFLMGLEQAQFIGLLSVIIFFPLLGYITWKYKKSKQVNTTVIEPEAPRPKTPRLNGDENDIENNASNN